MAIERPLSLEFIKDYFTNTYTVTSSDVSFRAINLARGRTTPDSFVDFENNQVDRFTYISSSPSGSVSGINSATGDLSSVFANYITFQQYTAGSSSQSSSVWKLTNTYHYYYLTSKYTVTFYFDFDSIVGGGSFTGTIFLERGSSATGTFSIFRVLTGGPQTSSYSFTPSASDNDYFRIRVENNATSGIYMNLGIGILVT